MEGTYERVDPGEACRRRLLRKLIRAKKWRWKHDILNPCDENGYPLTIRQQAVRFNEQVTAQRARMEAQLREMKEMIDAEYYRKARA